MGFLQPGSRAGGESKFCGDGSIVNSMFRGSPWEQDAREWTSEWAPGAEGSESSDVEIIEERLSKQTRGDRKRKWGSAEFESDRRGGGKPTVREKRGGDSNRRWGSPGASGTKSRGADEHPVEEKVEQGKAEDKSGQQAGGGMGCLPQQETDKRTPGALGRGGGEEREGLRK